MFCKRDPLVPSYPSQPRHPAYPGVEVVIPWERPLHHGLGWQAHGKVRLIFILYWDLQMMEPALTARVPGEPMGGVVSGTPCAAFLGVSLHCALVQPPESS